MKTKTISLFSTLIACFLLLSCAQHKSYVKVFCRHEAVLCCITLRDYGVPCRIAVGPTKDLKAHHAQAQAFIGGRWLWVHYDRQTGKIIFCEQDNFEPVAYFPLESFLYAYFHIPVLLPRGGR